MVRARLPVAPYMLQDDLVREPVRHEVGDHGEHEAEDQALRAAERFAEEQQQGAHRAEQQRVFTVLDMVSIRNQTRRSAGRGSRGV